MVALKYLGVCRFSDANNNAEYHWGSIMEDSWLYVFSLEKQIEQRGNNGDFN